MHCGAGAGAGAAAAAVVAVVVVVNNSIAIIMQRCSFQFLFW